MSNRNVEPSQVESGAPPPAPPPPPPHDPSAGSRAGNTVFKSGPLFLSSKGIGWTSWKKRWFILTRTSLVFFRSDPNAVPQKGGEVNLTLGGIDLNNSGSVVVKSEKKLLTVLFPDGREGRAFTLKAETLEDLYEWKVALENALAQAPSTAHANGILKNDKIESNDGSSETLKDNQPQPVRPRVLGRPILLALEDVDGTPSFLEKALRFIEGHGVKVEGILRQAADVDDVERRVRDYEQGKNEFSSEEDAHVVADCVKYVIRELPSSPVPASCCNALLEACKTDRGIRVNAMRSAIYETFPEPNRRLLQRILMMMQTVASHKAENRMSSSAVAACMAPLLLRPLLAGDCEIETDFDVGGDGSIQLLRAAAAANHAQAIVITLLEEYGKIFGECSMSPIMYSDSEESGSESEEATDDEMSYDDEEQDDVTGSDAETGDELESSGTCSGSVDSEDREYDDKGSEVSSSSSKNSDACKVNGTKPKFSSSSPKTSLPQRGEVQNKESIQNKDDPGRDNSPIKDERPEVECASDEANMTNKLDLCPSSSVEGSPTTSNKSSHASRRLTVWGRTPAKKNLSMESVDYDFGEEFEIQRLEATKGELQNKILEEAKENAALQSCLENRKKALLERRLTLEQEVARLKEQLQKERDLRMALEAGLKISQGPLPNLANINEKTKADLEEIDQAEKDIANLNNMVNDFGGQLDMLRDQKNNLSSDSRNVSKQEQNYQTKSKDKKKDAGALGPSHSEHSRNKDVLSGQAENDNEKKMEPSSSASKYPPLHQHPDPRNAAVRSVGLPTNSSTSETLPSRPTAPKRTGARIEGPNHTSSALTKLTTRLNFLKERRSQIANELQNMDRGRSQPFENLDKSRGPESQRSLQNSDETQGSSDVQPMRNPETSRTANNLQSIQDSDKRAGTDNNQSRKSDADKGTRTGGQNQNTLDRGKSENHTTINTEKGTGQDSSRFTTARTITR
ncbi:rho GTPase-activating protein REN1 [Cucumis melo]|uniref:Rho GTPase-activating protein REN1 n=1 Tax=Cucumis melo TaxID=3656 RepID=A0A1S4DW13_CUCME|nr:rho GTPase-activating protein REN1 [Cucumis melo]XP_050938255.1 rho GTPase-activating protein REN1 [Cucumis melo]XP_050938256.1 rho GTPase-activating protein REN1 [Cucumis melo]